MMEDATVLAGTLASAATPAHMARARKFQNFREYRALFPEAEFVFIGDAGQADALVGAMMLEQYPRQVRAVFIHDVVGAARATTGDGRAKAEYERLGVRFFATYAGAAAYIFRAQGLLDDDAARAVRAPRARRARLWRRAPRRARCACSRRRARARARDRPDVRELGVAARL